VVFRGADLRAAALRLAVLRAAVLRVALLRAAVLRPADLRTAVLRAADFRDAVLRTVVLRAADLRRTVFLAPVLRGRPGLRLLGMTPSVLLFAHVCRWVSHFSSHANRLRLLPSAVCMRELRSPYRYGPDQPLFDQNRMAVRIKAGGAMFAVRGRRTG
jgi:uncharacterized protein YjbI with pentapeptide repeats